MLDIPGPTDGVLAVRAFIERDDRPFLIDETSIGGGAVDADSGVGVGSYVIESADSQGPLAELYAFGTTIEDAAHHLAEQVWEVARRDITPGDHGRAEGERTDDQTPTQPDFPSEATYAFPPDEVHTIRVCTSTVTRCPVTSVAHANLTFQIPYTVAYAAHAAYAVVEDTVPALSGLAGTASTDRDAIANLVCRIRVKILSGALAPLIPATWRGTLLMHRMRVFDFPVAQLAGHSAA